jgi:hypothetical protein
MCHVQHPCQRRGCAGTAKHPLNFCDACWRRLPSTLAWEVQQARRRGVTLKMHPTPQYLVALRRAAEALEGAA